MKKKKDEIPKTDKYNILVYNDEYMIYYDGILASFDKENIWDSGYFVTGENYQYLLGTNIRFTVSNLEQHETIKLDDTLMKRIAKFNKEVEIKKLDETIKNKQEKIKELDDLLQDKEKRWKKVKDYIANIYNIDLEDDYDDEEYWED